MGKIKKLAAGAGLAAAAGYIAGLLTAPQSGKETREDIKEAAVKGKTEVEKDLKKLHTELSDVIDQVTTKGSDVSGRAKKELKKALDTASDAKEKAREVLSAVHEGDAADKDLKRALTDATRALDHLKTYLKK